MTDEELRKKLAAAKKMKVPAGYWDAFTARFQQRLDGETGRQGDAETEQRVDRRPRVDEDFSPSHPVTPSPRRLLWVTFPAFAVLLVGVYFVGRRSVTRPTTTPIEFTSEGTSGAQKVFQEMLTLFPERINWVSFVDGKVDFSVSSVPTPNARPLVPLLVTVPRPRGALVAEWLLRPGQDTEAHAAWDASTTLSIHLQLDASDETLQAAIRLTSPTATASIENNVTPREGESVVVGSVRWNGRMVQLQVARLKNSRLTAAAAADENAPKVKL